MNKFAIVASATAAIAATASSFAGPLLTISGSVGGYAPFLISSNGASTATPGRFSYVGGVVNTFPSPDWAISWDLVGDDTTAASNTDKTAFITNGFRVQNFTASAKTFDIVLTLAAPRAASPSGLQCYATLGGTLTSDAFGSTATLTSTGALWTGMINGGARASSALMNPANVSTLLTTTFGPMMKDSRENFTAAMTDIGYRMQFTLGARSTAVFTGAWEVPAPSAIGLFAAFGIVGGRRRRETN